MFRQLGTIEPSFFKTTSGMHRPPFEGRHLVYYIVTECDIMVSQLLLETITITKAFTWHLTTFEYIFNFLGFNYQLGHEYFAN